MLLLSGSPAPRAEGPRSNQVVPFGRVVAEHHAAVEGFLVDGGGVVAVVMSPAHAGQRKHTLAGVGRRHHHRNHTSAVNQEALNRRMVLSDDSAERDHLIGAGPLSLGAGLPLSSSIHHRAHKRLHLDFYDEDQHLGGGGGGEELTAGGGAGPDQPGNPGSDNDVITVEFHSPAPDTAPSDWPRASGPQRQKAGNPTAWTLSDFYDYLAPDDDLSALDATPVPEPSPSPPADMDDENPRLPAVVPVVPQRVKPNAAGKGWPPSAPQPPLQGGGKGPVGAGPGGLGGVVGSDGCRLGFVRSGPGVCVPQCDAEPDFCLNGGVCTVVAEVGAFCSKYRPQSAEPQTDGMSVSTTADGSQPNVRKLCDTPPPPPQAHAHNLAYYDNIICQDDPQKKEELAKTPPPKKEEESMNIRNSHPSPKQENVRPIGAAPEQQEAAQAAQVPAQAQEHGPNNTEEEEEDEEEEEEESTEVNSLQNNLV
ncbi:hypothetical protein CRUP_037312 [Coryphaenoides rupestris]|nr:hypothetical protein CRUP_037312 [Coryphaenoides rupestris]